MATFHIPEIDNAIHACGAKLARRVEQLENASDLVRGWGNEASISAEFKLTEEQVDAFVDALADPDWPTVIGAD